jgi:trans-aconitate methyltransferase
MRRKKVEAPKDNTWPIKQVIKTLKDKISSSNITTVLDLGSSSFDGQPIDNFHNYDILFNVFNGKAITGIDIFEKDVDWRKNNGPEGEYLCMNILDFKPEKKYDVVLCHHMLEHLTQEAHDIVFELIENSFSKYAIIGGPIGESGNDSCMKKNWQCSPKTFD